MLPLALFVLFYLGVWLILRFWGPAARLAVLRVARPLASRLSHLVEEHGAMARVRGTAGIAAVAFVGIVITTAAANVFLELGELLRYETHVLEKIDGMVHSNAQLWISADATLFFRAMTMIGDPPVLAGITIVVVAALFVRGYRLWATYLLVTAGTGALLNLLLKEWFARERPDLSEALRHATGYSFPSGHSMGAMFVFAAIGWLAVRILPSWRRDSVSIALATTLITAVGVSRLYLGVHWFSDVVGGFAAGVAWVATVTTLFELWLWLPRNRRKQLRHHSDGSVS